MRDYTVRFIYEVNGTVFEETTEPWGDICKQAKALAREEHTYLHRTVIYPDDRIKYEFYAKGGAFIDERYADINQSGKIW